MSAPTLQDTEELYLNLTKEERIGLNEVTDFTKNFVWETLERRLLAEYWIKYGYLARKNQEKEVE